MSPCWPEASYSSPRPFADTWKLIGLRFLMGISLAGLLPAIVATIQHSVPQGGAAGTILGYNTSAQYAGQVLGPLAGGYVGGHVGMTAVFLATALIMFGARRSIGPAAGRPVSRWRPQCRRHEHSLRMSRAGGAGSCQGRTRAKVTT